MQTKKKAIVGIGAGIAALLLFMSPAKASNKKQVIEDNGEVDDVDYDFEPPPKQDKKVDLSKVDISATPKPGSFYKIQKGDTLLNIAGDAFNVGAGGTRLSKAKMINKSRYNERFIVPAPDSTFYKNHFPIGLISFFPNYSFDMLDQIEDEVIGSKGNGGSYPIIWIPKDSNDEPVFYYI